ncbi:hypothetical protein [Bradyrhizobium sp. F1.13.3]|jgi:hypothetical protein|uniref:hypothetical protein n=1 Tax=Bradyrhizobium sp. F1.13.3 TaxID=3156351 RepID=UPI00339B59BF
MLVAAVLVRIGFRRNVLTRRAFAFCKSIAIVHRDCAFLFPEQKISLRVIVPAFPVSS